MYDELFEAPKDELLAFKRLFDITRVLRSPGGCPWDKEQTHDSLIRGMIEEAYESVEAIENKDYKNLCEELGDVLLQVVMHGLIAEEGAEFSMADIANGESEKMLRRHPHVFGKKLEKISPQSPLDVDNVLELWENVKQGEKEDNSVTKAMRTIPRHLPALLRSEKIQAKAKRVGFDWDHIDAAFDKVSEETGELKEAIMLGDKAHISEELGDLLFAVVNVARFLDVDPEKALNATSEKFVKRFAYVESMTLENGKALEESTLQEMDALWEKAKSLE